MRKSALIIVALLYALQLSAQTDIPEGNISGIWTKEGSPYRIQGNVVVGYYDTLEIKAGVVVDFEGHYKLRVRGEFSAIGGIGDTIRFTRVTNDEFMDPDTVGLADTTNLDGSWSGIEWYSTVITGYYLSHCIFEFINSVDNNETEWSRHRAPIHKPPASLTGLSIKNSIIRNNYGARCGGIHGYYRTIIDSCLITNNKAVKLSNKSFSTAGGILIHGDHSMLTNSVISNNKAYDSYSAGGVRISGENPLIMNNIIKNNSTYTTTTSAGGIYCGGYPRIIQNLVICNESRWIGGIYYIAGGGKLYNNTICNNKGHRNEPGGIKFEGSSGTIAMNNIIYGNEDFTGLSQIGLQSLSTQPVVKYNLIGNGMEEILGNEYGAIRDTENYFGNPGIINPGTVIGIGDTSNIEDWQLESGSFLINQGNNEAVNQYHVEFDLAGNRRMNYGHVDPGCLEFRIQSFTPDSVISSPEIWIADTIHIRRDTELQAKVTIYPGTVILSHGHYTIYALDTLDALGTRQAPILWTIKDTSGYSNTENEEGGWGPITLHGTTPRIFRYCVFEYGKVKRPSGHSIGLIWGINNGNIEIDHCVFRNCLGINASMVYSESGANYGIGSTIFHNNKITPGGALITLRSASNLFIHGNQIFNNDCLQDMMEIGGANIEFIGNSIYHNNGRMNLNNCFNIDIINNTIVSNTRPFSIGAGDNARIVNSIIPELDISQEGYEIVSSYVPEDLCTDERCRDQLTEPPVFQLALSWSGTGNLQEIMQADYSLSSVSPGIDFGTIDTVGLNLGVFDIKGNPRIHNGRIDLGAYENQSDLPEITSHPVGGTFCVGENHILEVEYSGNDTVITEWFKNGDYIPGQDGDQILELDSILLTDEGNYHCEISNSYGKLISGTVYIKVNEKPGILIQPDDVWHEAGRPLKLSVTYTGSSPINFQWELDRQDIEGAEFPEYNLVPSDSSHEGFYSCRISNACGMVQTYPAAIYLAPQICMVTVSEASGHNLIVWEKKSKAPFLAYNIYRESVAAGIYDPMGTVPYDDLSVFVDTSADPTVQAYLYKITAFDTSGYETDIDLCKPHKTIHLLVTTNPELNSTQLSWDRYYGFDYQTYTIYRSNTGVNFDPVHSLSASLNSWTDPDASSGDLFYRIAVEKPDPCVPAGGTKKAGTGPYVHALSNMDDNKLKAGENPPDSIYLDNNSIDENMLPGSLVGRLVTIDLDTMDYYTYHLVSGEGDDDNASFTLIGDLLVSAISFDHETKESFSVRIRTTDNAAFFLERSFVIGINNTEEGTTTTGDTPPDSIYLDNSAIAENNNFGDPVGMLLTADKDSSDVHTYQLVSGTGDDNNIMFMITGNVLRAGYTFDFELGNTYTIRLRSTDLAGNRIERVFFIWITDIDETVGIQGIQESALRIYPNPISQSAIITFPNAENEPYRFILSDVSGKVYRIVEDISGSKYILQKGSLKRGLYFIELRGSMIYRGRIVIN